MKIEPPDNIDLYSPRCVLSDIPGLIGMVRQFICDAAPHPNPEIALAGSIALLSGITGKAYNTYTGAGLNQYILLLASTGMGKEAAASGISKLLAAVTATVPAAGGFKGPGLVSSAGLIKWLVKNPSFVSIIGEFGYKLKAISSPKANPNDELLKATLLDLHGKSGKGSVVDPMAYSDRDKQTSVIISPALTLLGESVPGIVYEALNDSMILSGLLPRFMVVEAKGQRAPFQENPALTPDPTLVQSLADLCGQCLTLNSYNNVHAVPANPEAKAKFREFSQWVTDQINGHISEIQRELWNRAHLKALKLATLCAVCINPHDPIVTINEAMWATRLIVDQTEALLSKFMNDEIGDASASHAKQQREVLRAIKAYLAGSWNVKWHGSEEMHRDGVITLANISKRLSSTAAFMNDKQGSTPAIHRAIKSLLEADAIREMPPTQMAQRYGKHPRAFAVSDPKAVLES